MFESKYKANRQQLTFDSNSFLLIVRCLRRRSSFVLVVSLFGLISLFLWYKSVDCDCFGENFCFAGTDNQGHTKRGIRFDCSLYSYLSDHKLLDGDAERTRPDYENLSDDWIPVFVTPCSSNHFNESRVMVKVIRETYKNAKIVYYDIGLTDEEADEVQSWCKVEYRKFNFSAFPPHVSQLKTYAFKIVMIEALKEWPSFFYIDSSVRIREPILYQMVDTVKSGINPSILSFNGTRHSIFATTYPTTYKYLPTSRLLASAYEEIAATNLFVSDSQYTRQILKWHALCLLTADCVGKPKWNMECDVKALQNHDVYYRYINRCHRFDQVSLSLVSIGVNLQIGNYNRTGYEEFRSQTKLGDVIRYTREFQRFVEVGRGDTIDHRLEIKC